MKYPFATAALNPFAGVIALCLLMFAGPALAADLRLIMFEEDGCVWCARWEEEIGPAYPNTEYAEIAPLSKLDIDDEVPEGITLDRPAHLTPTFVLLADGAEVGRMEGYPGPEFFWFLLDEIIAEANAGDS